VTPYLAPHCQALPVDTDFIESQPGCGSRKYIQQIISGWKTRNLDIGLKDHVYMFSPLPNCKFSRYNYWSVRRNTLKGCDRVTSVAADNLAPWIIISDDRCPVVRKLSWLVRQWDNSGNFKFVSKHHHSEGEAPLVQELDACPWSLILIHDGDMRSAGPEAIPFILRNLPGGKIATVAYVVPGTMWLTRQLYNLVSRNRRLLSVQHAASAR
jgi:predicted DCC family thiol-disulfide oxidoreductase YuxK